MSRGEKNIIWYYARSVVIMSVLLMPFFYLGKTVIGRGINIPVLGYITTSIFAPMILLFDSLCSAFEYCVRSEYHGAALMIPLYILAVIVYGYVLALIWSWVSFPKRRKNLSQ